MGLTVGRLDDTLFGRSRSLIVPDAFFLTSNASRAVTFQWGLRWTASLPESLSFSRNTHRRSRFARLPCGVPSSGVSYSLLETHTARPTTRTSSAGRS